MSRNWKLPLSATAIVAAVMLFAAGCENNKPGDGAEPTAPPPAGTNMPGAGSPGTTTGGPAGTNMPGAR